MLSTRFKNGVLNKDIGMAINRIYKAYKYDRDEKSAAEHLTFFLQNCTKEEVSEFLQNSDLKYKEDERWECIAHNVGTIAPEKGLIVEIGGNDDSDEEFEMEGVEEAPRPPIQSVEDSFEAMAAFTRCVAEKHSNGLFIAGPGGTGKTWTVNEVLRSMGMIEFEDYYMVKGYSTPQGLYRTLFENQNKLIVFDDCDSIFRDITGLNILKAVLDTYPERLVSWNSSRLPDDLDSSFYFTGQIIFISNINPKTTTNESFKAVMTRVLSVLVGGTKEEIRDRIVKLLPKVAKNLTDEEREAIREFIENYYRDIRDLSIRYVVHMASLVKSHPDDWQKLAWSLM